MKLEDALLERFFIEPGLTGPIRSVRIADEDLMELFATSSFDEAKSRFIQSLPSRSFLADYLSGRSMPVRHGKPEFIRILVFVCWMQVTQSRPGSTHDFRDTLEGHLGQQYQDMRGLNPMWEYLSRYLAQTFNIELTLPGIYPHSQIGRTLRIAFPTWRDLGALRRVRSRIAVNLRLDPRTVFNTIQSSIAHASALPSLAYNFNEWNQARLRNDLEAFDLPFWKAWTSVVSEFSGFDELETSEDEYGDISLAAVGPSGKKDPLRSIDVSPRFSEALRSDLRRGFVFMEGLGFGRFRSTRSMDSVTLMVASSKMSGIGAGNTKRIAPLTDEWFLVTFLKPQNFGGKAGGKATAGVGWSDGIRVGGGYLGRAPLTPAYVTSAKGIPSHFEVDGIKVQSVTEHGRLEIAEGTHQGQLVAVETKSNKVRLIASALEQPDQRRRQLDDAVEVHEDLIFADHWPRKATEDLAVWPGHRVEPASELRAIGEALYSKALRGLSLSEGVEIIARALRRRESAPNPWDIVRSFADAAWIDLTSLRNFPARRMLQRGLAFRRYNNHVACGMVRGAISVTVAERLLACADAVGGKLHENWGLSEWCNSTWTIECSSAEALNEFLERSSLNEVTALKTEARFIDSAEPISLHRYSKDARWQPETGAFHSSAKNENTPGLYRMVSSKETDPKLYVLRSNAGDLAVFRSASIAILAEAEQKSQRVVVADGQYLRRGRGKVQLPSSWARWISFRTACNAGPMLEQTGWGYAYPCDRIVSDVVDKQMFVSEHNHFPNNWKNFLASRSRRNRHLLINNNDLNFSRRNWLEAGQQ